MLLMGKSTISMTIFNSFLLVYQAGYTQLLTQLLRFHLMRVSGSNWVRSFFRRDERQFVLRSWKSMTYWRIVLLFFTGIIMGLCFDYYTSML